MPYLHRREGTFRTRREFRAAGDRAGNIQQGDMMARRDRPVFPLLLLSLISTSSIQSSWHRTEAAVIQCQPAGDAAWTFPRRPSYDRSYGDPAHSSDEALRSSRCVRVARLHEVSARARDDRSGTRRDHRVENKSGHRRSSPAVLRLWSVQCARFTPLPAPAAGVEQAPVIAAAAGRLCDGYRKIHASATCSRPLASPP